MPTEVVLLLIWLTLSFIGELANRRKRRMKALEQEFDADLEERFEEEGWEVSEPSFSQAPPVEVAAEPEPPQRRGGILDELIRQIEAARLQAEAQAASELAPSELPPAKSELDVVETESVEVVKAPEPVAPIRSRDPRPRMFRREMDGSEEERVPWWKEETKEEVAASSAAEPTLGRGQFRGMRALRRAIIAKEVLGPPMALRDPLEDSL